MRNSFINLCALEISSVNQTRALANGIPRIICPAAPQRPAPHPRTRGRVHGDGGHSPAPPLLWRSCSLQGEAFSQLQQLCDRRVPTRGCTSRPPVPGGRCRAPAEKVRGLAPGGWCGAARRSVGDKARGIQTCTARAADSVRGCLPDPGRQAPLAFSPSSSPPTAFSSRVTQIPQPPTDASEARGIR